MNDEQTKARNFQILALRGALKLELKGMTHSRGSAYAQAKRQFGFTGSKAKVLAQLNRHIDEHILPEAPHWCFGICVADEDGNRIVVMIKRGEIGYWRTTFDPDADLDEQVRVKNNALGVSRQHAAAMQAGSIFGWDCPAAKAESYDEDGEPITQ